MPHQSTLILQQEKLIYKKRRWKLQSFEALCMADTPLSGYQDDLVSMQFISQQMLRLTVLRALANACKNVKNRQRQLVDLRSLSLLAANCRLSGAQGFCLLKADLNFERQIEGKWEKAVIRIIGGFSYLRTYCIFSACILKFDQLLIRNLILNRPIACRELQQRHINMDSKLTLVTQQSGDGFYIAQFKTSELAIFSFYVESNKECLLLDPVFDVRTYHEFILKRQTKLKYVALTHYHADYLSGHTEFKVPIIMGANSTKPINGFKIKECPDGETISLGAVSIKVIHTPGHTLESSCFLLKDKHGKDVAIFTGDTVFLGEVGRPDLACSDNITSHDLAAMLFDSIQKLRVLDGSLRIYPGHGSGSACGKSIGAGNFCTMGAQYANNYGFKFTDKNEFIKAATANIPKPPSYFFHDAGLNQKGALSYEKAHSNAHRNLSPQEFFKHKNSKIIDTRMDVGPGLLKGSYWLPSAGPIVNWISNFVAPEEEFLLVCEEGKSQDIVDRFFRIGYFKILGYNGFNICQLKEQFVKPTILKFITLAHLKERTHLDVRSLPEYQSAGVIQGSIRIPLPELEKRVTELKEKKNLVVSCLSGARSKVAFSILARHGIQAKVLAEEFKEFQNNGIQIVEYAQ